EVEMSGDEGIVLDTTGSVVYTGEEICRRLQLLTTVVHLAASAAEEETLVARYLSDPKPVLWGNLFSQLPGESARRKKLLRDICPARSRFFWGIYFRSFQVNRREMRSRAAIPRSLPIENNS